MTHLDFDCVSVPPLLQGLTGRPGDAGPQGKVGPSVSALFFVVTTIMLLLRLCESIKTITQHLSSYSVMGCVSFFCCCNITCGITGERLVILSNVLSSHNDS